MKLALIIVSLLFMSCSAEFRGPFCEEGKIDFPERYHGVYRANVPKTDLNGSYIFESLEFHWGKDGVLFETKKHQALAKLNEDSAPGFPANLDDLRSRFSLCQVGGAYYIQARNDQDLYSLTRIDFSVQGMTLSTISADSSALDRRGIANTRLPGFSYLEDFEESSGPSIPMLTGGTVHFVVDNRDVPAETLAPLLKPNPISYFIQKVSDSPESWSEDKELTTLKF